LELNIYDISQKIKSFAIEIGFDNIGITKAAYFADEEPHLLKWLANAYQADMSYMENNIDKRLDSSKIVHNAKSVIVVLKNYFPRKKLSNDTFQISKYAYGTDYHKVVKDDLYKLLGFIKLQFSNVHSRVFVDSAPVLEKKLAQMAGLGWIGKNSLLLTKKGSYYFIGEIILDIELEYDKPFVNNFCGNCNACIDACPTNAIVENYIVDSNKCISYHTIERKGEFETDFELNFKNYIFGCDICQDVCPWNRKPLPTNDERFDLSDEIKNLSNTDYKNLSEQKFNYLFKNTPVERTKYKGFIRNIKYVAKQNKEFNVSNQE